MTSSTKALREALAHVGLHGKLADAVLPIIEQERATAHREGMEAAAKLADAHATDAWEIAKREGQNDACASGRNHGARAIAKAIRTQMETGK